MAELSGEDKEALREIIEKLSGLDRKSLMSYWINSALEEAETYNEIARRIEYYGWDPRIPTLFEELARGALNSAEAFLEEYKRTYGNSSLAEIEVEGIPLRFSREKLNDYLRNGRLEDLLETLMDSEKLASEVYSYLSENSEGERREMFARLASIEHEHYLRLKSIMESLKRE